MISDDQLSFAFADWCSIESCIAGLDASVVYEWPTSKQIFEARIERDGFKKGYIAGVTDVLDKINEIAIEPQAEPFLKLSWANWVKLLKLRYEDRNMRIPVDSALSKV